LVVNQPVYSGQGADIVMQSSGYYPPLALPSDFSGTNATNPGYLQMLRHLMSS
jgi:hypothetical protein